ncbi:MAG: hypothetical protein F6K10_01150 [Moorea sp. SIO2B7]|nr:hypothetical protein [Moorena sp. SIO2B7]
METPIYEESKSDICGRLDLFDATKREKAQNLFQTSPGQILPPKISRSSTKGAAKIPQLPNFPHPQPTTTSENQAEIEVKLTSDSQTEAAISELKPEIASDVKNEQTSVKEPPATPEQVFEPETSIKERVSEIPSEIHKHSDSPPVETFPGEPIGESPRSAQEAEGESDQEDDFESLKLQERFWSRLNALAAVADSSEWLYDEESSPEDFESEEISALQEQLTPESELVAHEEVIEASTADETLPPESELVAHEEVIEASTADETLPPEEEVIEASTADETLPPESELVAHEEIIEASTADETLPPESELVAHEEIIEASTADETLPPEEVLPSSDESDDWEIAMKQLLRQKESEEASVEAVETSNKIETESSEQEADIIAENWLPETELVENKPFQSKAMEKNSLEIVVEYEAEEEEEEEKPEIPKIDASGLPYPKEVISPREESSVSPSLQSNLPVPAPILSLRKKDKSAERYTLLKAGEQVVMCVNLPPYPGSVYVKLWIQDRQSRSLLDGPRALVNLTPNPSGQLEAITQITVPFGSMEISFQAIAIDPETQEESHKVSLERLVIPANLSDESDISFDDLEL